MGLRRSGGVRGMEAPWRGARWGGVCWRLQAVTDSTDWRGGGYKTGLVRCNCMASGAGGRVLRITEDTSIYIVRCRAPCADVLRPIDSCAFEGQRRSQGGGWRRVGLGINPRMRDNGRLAQSTTAKTSNGLQEHTEAGVREQRVSPGSFQSNPASPAADQNDYHAKPPN